MPIRLPGLPKETARGFDKPNHRRDRSLSLSKGAGNKTCRREKEKGLPKEAAGGLDKLNHRMEIYGNLKTNIPKFTDHSVQAVLKS